MISRITHDTEDSDSVLNLYLCMFLEDRRLTISAQTMWLQFVAVAIVGA